MSVSSKDEPGTARKKIQEMRDQKSKICAWFTIRTATMDLPYILWVCDEDVIPSEWPKKAINFLAALANTPAYLSQRRGW